MRVLVGTRGYTEKEGALSSWLDLLPRIFWTDHTCTGELHEQQQAGSCVWLQAAESGSGKMVGATWGRKPKGLWLWSQGIQSFHVAPALSPSCWTPSPLTGR